MKVMQCICSVQLQEKKYGNRVPTEQESPECFGIEESLPRSWMERFKICWVLEE